MDSYNTQQYDLQKAVYIKDKVVALYQQHNPSKVSEIDSVLVKYKENTGLLFRNRRHKYGENSLPVYEEELEYPSIIRVA